MKTQISVLADQPYVHREGEGEGEGTVIIRTNLCSLYGSTPLIVHNRHNARNSKALQGMMAQWSEEQS